MNQRDDYQLRGFQRGAATSAAKMSGTVGFKMRRRSAGEVSETQLAKEVDAASRGFWAKRNFVGVYETDHDAAFRSTKLKKTSGT